MDFQNTCADLPFAVNVENIPSTTKVTDSYKEWGLALQYTNTGLY